MGLSHGSPTQPWYAWALAMMHQQGNKHLQRIWVPGAAGAKDYTTAPIQEVNTSPKGTPGCCVLDQPQFLYKNLG